MRARAAAAAAAAKRRRKLFRHKGGTIAQRQRHAMITAASGVDHLEKIEALQKYAKKTKKSTQTKSQKYQWKVETQRLNKRQNDLEKELQSVQRWWIQKAKDAQRQGPSYGPPSTFGPRARDHSKAKRAIPIIPMRGKSGPQSRAVARRDSSSSTRDVGNRTEEAASLVSSPSNKSVSQSPRPNSSASTSTSASTTMSIGQTMRQLTDWAAKQDEERESLRTDIFAQLGAVRQLIKDIQQKFSNENDAHALASVLTGHKIPITNSDARLEDVKKLLQALTQAFETLHERSNNEFDQLQEEATDAARRAYTALRAGKTVLSGKKSNAAGNEEQTVLEIIVKHKKINLQVSEQMQQDAVWELQELNETFLEEIEELQIINKVVVDGASDKWGWSDEDHQLFLKLEKQFSARSSNAERLRLHMTRLQSSFPMLSIEAIRTHRKFYIEYQRYQTKRKDKLELWKRMIERRSQELEKRFLDEHKALQLRQEMDLKRAERLQKDKARREKKAKLQIKLNDKRRLQKEQSDKAAAAELERQRLQDEATAKRRESNHAAVAALKQERALAELAEMQAQQEAERKMLQIKKKQAVVNAERTAYRKQELAMKQQERETQRMLSQIRQQKQKQRLEELKAQNPYHDAVQQMTTDTDRLNQHTLASKNAVEQSKVDATLFKKHGYSDKELFKDIRFKIGMAMRAAGLNKGYAQQVLAKMTSTQPAVARNLRSQI